MKRVNKKSSPINDDHHVSLREIKLVDKEIDRGDKEPEYRYVDFDKYDELANELDDKRLSDKRILRTVKRNGARKGIIPGAVCGSVIGGITGRAIHHDFGDKGTKGRMVAIGTGLGALLGGGIGAAGEARNASANVKKRLEDRKRVQDTVDDFYRRPDSEIIERAGRKAGITGGLAGSAIGGILGTAAGVGLKYLAKKKGWVSDKHLGKILPSAATIGAGLGGLSGAVGARAGAVKNTTDRMQQLYRRRAAERRKRLSKLS